MPWDPTQYHKFQAERAAPFTDLLQLITVRDGLHVVDLGCGTGELTAKLAEALPNSDVTGIDSSAEMLAKAQTYSRPGLRFEAGEIQAVTGQWDIVFSHAAIQWVDDHEALIPRLFSLVKPGGQLAVQLPSNHFHASHRLIREIAATEPYWTALDGWTRTVPVLSIERYAELLYANGGSAITVFEKVYPHVLENSDGMAEWTAGTALVPYFERLTPPLRESFMTEYKARLRQILPDSPVFYGFRRILFAATK